MDSDIGKDRAYPSASERRKNEAAQTPAKTEKSINRMRKDT
jgi:hypothetical protein